MPTEAERLAKKALSHALTIKDRVSESLEKAIHSRLDRRAHPEAQPLSQDNPLNLVCAACRAGPFSYDGFREAIAKDLGHYDNTTGYCYTRTWHQIIESIDKESCSWCRIVKRTRDGLPSDKFPYGKKNVEVRLQIEVSPVAKCFYIVLDGEKAVEYTIYANKDESAVEELEEEVRFFPKETFTDFQMAIECVEKCRHHEHCPPLEETHLPTRVVDCSDLTKPRLFETNRKIVGHYCTLSYVWGGDQLQKTTKANIHKYVNEGINVPLPQTIADAITVTHKLGLQYLWVDALCIIQDSEEDKIKELGIMGQIYRRAYLTISVLSAHRADEGFLFDERPPDVLPYYLLNRPQSPSRMVAEYYIPRQPHSPLDTRGWCFQESTLSPRTVIFQPPSVRYRCRSFSEMEISRPDPVGGYTYTEHKPFLEDNYVLFPIQGRHNNPTPSTEDLNRLWRRTLWEYSERKFTASSDRLIALASIVEVFQSAMNDQYIAGLWKKTLLYDLHWRIWPPMGPHERPLPRPKGYRAPTWSWASVDAKLDLASSLSPPPDAASYEAEILSYEVTPKVRELPLGELVDGKLTIRAKMHPLMRNGKKCTFTEHKGEADRFVQRYTNWSWTPPLGNCLEPVGFSIDGMGAEEQKEKRVAGIRFDSREGTERDKSLDVYVLILRAGRKYRLQGDWMNGFLLVRAEGKAEKYRRVAFLDLQYHYEWPDWFDNAPLRTVVLV